MSTAYACPVCCSAIITEGLALAGPICQGCDICSTFPALVELGRSVNLWPFDEASGSTVSDDPRPLRPLRPSDWQVRICPS